MAYSAAMTTEVSDDLEAHLARDDGQEDVCIATYRWSTGERRKSVVLTSAILPGEGDRKVHGTASFSGEYILRACLEAGQRDEGVALLHSHPRGRGWQMLSSADFDTERDFSALAEQLTGMPLVGMTFGVRSRSWSARVWRDGQPVDAESVRVVGRDFRISFNDVLKPTPTPTPSQVRTVSAWGDEAQADLARLKVLVVGVGSVGLDVAQRLAAAGVVDVGVMDFDRVELVNLDRMIGATREDAASRRLKVDVAKRQVLAAATDPHATVTAFPQSVVTPSGLRRALDYDIVFSCVDKPHPRAVLNTIAYADLIPVIDGGIGIGTMPDGSMRSATMRTHTLVPGIPCMFCTKQLKSNDVSLDMNGLLDNPKYIETSGRESQVGAPNVALLSGHVGTSMLMELVRLVCRPGGQGVALPSRYLLSIDKLTIVEEATKPFCTTEQAIAVGDARTDLTIEREDPQPTELSEVEPPSQRSPLRQLLRRMVSWAKRANR